MAKFDLSFFYNKRNLYILGFLLAFVVTFMEVSRGRHLNFLAFADSTIDFWRGVSPYTPEFRFQPYALLPLYSGLFGAFHAIRRIARMARAVCLEPV